MTRKKAKQPDMNSRLMDVLLKTVGMAPAGVTKVEYSKEVGGHGAIKVHGATYDMDTKRNRPYIREFELSDTKGVRELDGVLH